MHWFRQRRNLLLADTDWTQTVDSPLTDSKENRISNIQTSIKRLTK